MSTSATPIAATPSPAVPKTWSDLRIDIEVKMRIASDAAARFRDALENDELREVTAHYLLDQLARARAASEWIREALLMAPVESVDQLEKRKRMQAVLERNEIEERILKANSKGGA